MKFPNYQYLAIAGRQTTKVFYIELSDDMTKAVLRDDSEHGLLAVLTKEQLSQLADELSCLAQEMSSDG